MFLEIFEQILNARKGLLFEVSVKTHGREEAFEICQKAQKQKNSNSEIGSYFGMIGRTIVLLLCGGDKKSQHKDIRYALEYFKDHKKREKEDG